MYVFMEQFERQRAMHHPQPTATPPSMMDLQVGLSPAYEPVPNQPHDVYYHHRHGPYGHRYSRASQASQQSERERIYQTPAAVAPRRVHPEPNVVVRRRQSTAPMKRDREAAEAAAKKRLSCHSPDPAAFFREPLHPVNRRQSVMVGQLPAVPLAPPPPLPRRPSGNECYSVPASPVFTKRTRPSGLAAIPSTRQQPPNREAMMRSKSQSRSMVAPVMVERHPSNLHEVMNHPKLKELASSSTHASPKFAHKRPPSGACGKSAPTTPVTARKPGFFSLGSLEKPKPRAPLSCDASLVLELFDPDKSERRRLAAERSNLLVARDRIGFDSVQQNLKSFNLQKNLARPKRRALHEFYNDDDAELEALAKVIDPNAPRPTGTMVTPARGDFPVAMANANGTRTTAAAKSVEAVLERHASVQPKAICATVLDHSGKLSTSLTYGKLHSRALKVANLLLNKAVTVQIPNAGKEKRPLCLPGDRVALVYPNTEPLAFVTAFYGCLIAGMIPVPVEVPLSRRDAGLQQFGFLLGSCGVRIALTSEACLKGLPKAATSRSEAASSSAGTSNSNGSAAGANYLHATNGSTGSHGSGASGHHLPSASSPQKDSDVADFKGWPRLNWVVTEHLSKPSRDWRPVTALATNETAYVEYTTDREGSVKGVCVSREAMLAHARAIVAAMGYKDGETMVSVLDFKRDVGLWHGVLASIYAGMRVIYVPYSVMKVNPTSWMFHASKLQASTALVKSRDLHWSVMATPRDSTGQVLPPSGNAAPMTLASLRCVVVADGANPWSLSPCDQFAAAFHSRGLRPDSICPVAGSPETGTLCLRRPTETGGGSSGRGTLSMAALSYNVVRVDQENSLTSLTVQDSGQIVPGGLAVVIRPNGPARLCKTDEIGELCIHAPSTASGYFGLKGQTAAAFQVQPLGHDDQALGPANYVRSGLVGFMTPEGLAFIIGNRSGLMTVGGRQHSADDLIATVLAVDSMKFIYRGRIAVFSVPVLRDERVIVVAEQKPDVPEEEAFNWMIRVIQAVDSIHQLSLYCIELVPANQLPKTPLGGLHVSETRQRFLDGCLHPSTLLMCPQSSVINLPKPRDPPKHDVGPAAIMMGNIVQGARVAAAVGRELTIASEEPIYLIDILRQRATTTSDHVLFTLMNSRGAEADSLNCGQLLKKAERIGALLLDKGHLNPGDHVALIFPPGLELVTAFYGCLAAGLVPVCIRPPSATNLSATLITVRMVVDVSKSVALLSTSSLIKLLRCKEASHRVDAKAWPTILDIDDMPSSSVARRRNVLDAHVRRPSDTCYLDFAVSTTGQLAGIVMTATATAALSKSLKVACELYPSRHVALSLDPYSGLGFALWCLASVYAGHHSVLIPPADVEANPSLWLSVCSAQKVRDTFCSYSVMEHCVRELAPQVMTLKDKGINLSCLRTCVAIAEERPRVSLCSAFSKLFAPLGLSPRAVSTSFGSRVNPAVCMQGASSPDPATVYVDARALRNDRIALVEKGSPHSLPLMESGKLLPGVKVVIADPETKGQCADSHMGEIWVACGHNAAGYFSIFGEETHLHTDHFTARLKTGDTETQYARTGYLGFLRQTESITADGELHDAVFVVGAMDETMMLRGMRYHPIDVETTAIRSHRRVIESAVFTWTNSLVVVAETDAPEAEALDLVPVITSAILEEHHLTVGVVVLVDPFAIPINSRGEKQRMHLRDAFVKDQLDPLFVSYNM
uniref:AMP-binding domain-containing protein n=1 Tax=Panagrellus redivivus TaxID=6233 RepID=A0A7E4W3K9_PANRE